MWLQANLHKFWSATKEAYDTDKCWHITREYANLMQRPLELWMFVPCHENMMPIKKPMASDGLYLLPDTDFKEDMKKYQQGKDQVLFDGWVPLNPEDGPGAEHHELVATFDGESIYTHGADYEGRTVEELASNLKPKTTKAFLKQIGL